MRTRWVSWVALVGGAACGAPSCSSSSAPPADVATGQVGAWQTQAPLPVARANLCAAAIGDWVLVIGGNRASGSGFAATDEIDAAELGSAGMLGPWQVAGHTPSPVSECDATSDGERLFVIDGLYDDDTQDGHVFAADFGSDGTLGALASLGALPAGVVTIATAATVHDDELLVMDQLLPGSGSSVVTLRTPLAGGAAGSAALAWTSDDWKIGFHAQSEYAFTDAYAYSIGGYQDPSVGAVADVYVAALGADGAITSVTPTAALPAPVAFGQAVAADGWVFVAGGRAQTFAASGSTAVYAAAIGSAGALAAWTSATPLPVERTNQAMALVGDYLVLAGGGSGGPGDTTVLTAQVRYPPAP